MLLAYVLRDISSWRYRTYITKYKSWIFVQNIHYKFFPNGYEIGFPGCTDAICTSFIDGTCIEFMINKTGYMYFTVSLNQPLDH